MINLRDIESYADYIAYTYEDLPQQIIERSAGTLAPQTSDVATVLSAGTEWLFEYTKQFQPQTGNILCGAKWFVYGRDRGDGIFTNHVAAEINEKIIVLNRAFRNHNPADQGYDDEIATVNRRLAARNGEHTKITERHLSLPEAIGKAYYWRFDGLDVPLSPAVGIYSRLLPFPIGRPWQAIDNYLSDIRMKNKLSQIYDQFPGAEPKRKADLCTNLMIFLDARPGLKGKKGEVLFVKNHKQDGKIYCIRDGDISNIMVLKKPQMAIDEYCSYILTDNEKNFSFTEYT